MNVSFAIHMNFDHVWADILSHGHNLEYWVKV